MNTKSIRNDWKLIESLIQDKAKVLDIDIEELKKYSPSQYQVFSLDLKLFP